MADDNRSLILTEWWQRPQVNDGVLVLLVGAIALLGVLSPDRINVGDGLGWDGYRYGELAQNFYERFRLGLDKYYVGRILPSFLIFHFFKLFSIPPTFPNIIAAFSTFNGILITFGAYLWCLIAKELNFSLRGKWLGFTGLFLNFFVLKFINYYPVLTDTCAYFLCLGMVYGYFKNNNLLVFVFAFLGNFTWTTSLYFGGLLILFPKQPNESPEPPLNLAAIFATLATLAAGVYMVILVESGRNIREAWMITSLVRPVAPLSIVIALAYLGWGLFYLLQNRQLWDWQQGLTYFQNRQFYLFLILILITARLPGLLATAPGNNISIGLVLEFTIWTSIIQPGAFFLAHTIYFGPFLILALFWWQPICKLLQKESLGLNFCLILGLMISLISESRYLVNLYPFLVPLIVQVSEGQNWSDRHYWNFTLISLFISKVWLTIGPLSPEFHTFPSQFYFMNIGPWMSHLMYIGQGAIVLVIGYGLHQFYLKPKI